MMEGVRLIMLPAPIDDSFSEISGSTSGWLARAPGGLFEIGVYFEDRFREPPDSTAICFIAHISDDALLQPFNLSQ